LVAFITLSSSYAMDWDVANLSSKEWLKNFIGGSSTESGCDSNVSPANALSVSLSKKCCSRAKLTGYWGVWLEGSISVKLQCVAREGSKKPSVSTEHAHGTV